MDDYDPRDFYDEVEAQFADEMEAMEAMGHFQGKEDVETPGYMVSDEMLKRAMEEEAMLAKNKENQAPNPDPIESQLQSLTDSLRLDRTAPVNTADTPDPTIEFSFMKSSSLSSPAPLQIRNSFDKKSVGNQGAASHKRTSSGEGLFGEDLEIVGEQDLGKRSKTDRESEKVYTRVPDGDFIRINTDTQRVYLKVKPYIEKVTVDNTSNSFLAQPFQYLKSQVMRDYREKKAEVEAAISRIRSHVVPAAGSGDSKGDPRNPEEFQKSELWVDDYMPTKYVDLLSDDGVNRSVLHWLKLWDGVVFGTKMRDKAPVEKPKWQSQEDWLRYQRFQEPDYDERGFPFKKAILVAGPPGLGKTTLAHIAAKHAGYNVVEMNASDDRSAAQFGEAIENSVRMTGVLNKDNKPNCLIIDEIDGAGAPAIQVLVKVLTAGTKFSKISEGDKKKKKERRLRRPIICICNDPWGIALRDLRKVATVITVPPTQSARLATRLKTICTVEQLTADMASLLFLCEKTDNDIRSSLNTLQFLKANKEPLSMVKLKGMDVGMKDKQQSLFKFWSVIFTQPKTKGNALQRLTDTQRHDQKRLSELMSLVGGTGELDKQVDGIHENLLLLKIREANFNKLTESLDWFTFYDSVDRAIRSTTSFELYTYLMYVPVAFNLQFAQVHPPKITIPAKQRELRQKQQEVEDMVDMIKRESLVQARLGLSCQSLTTELSSYLTRLICPIFRPVNIQLYSEKEKQSKEDLLTLMTCYDLQFVQHRSTEGLSQYVLEPDLYSLTRFSGVQEVKQLPYSVKQMLAREVDLKRIGAGGVEPSKPQNVPKEESTKVPKIDFTKEPTPVNFLSKVVSNKDAFARKKEAYVQKLRTFYKFNEGFSNAVRKPVKMSSFF
ncbi:hypothetical protein ACHWQZ_G011654 [Mnemiopsis leidyi]